MSPEINGFMLCFTTALFVFISGHMQPGPAQDNTISNQMFAFTVAILRNENFVSTGALISNQWVVTAASPFINSQEASSLRVRLDSYNNNRGEMLLSAGNVFSHPNYTHYYPEYDVALIRLAEIVPLAANIRGVTTTTKKCPPKLYQVPNRLPHELPIGGSDRKKSSLKLTRYRAFKRKMCRDFLSSLSINLTRNIICLAPIIGHYKCKPDTGAPVLGTSSAGELWGVITEWKSPNCSEQPSPILATRLTTRAMRQWIDQTVHRGEFRLNASYVN